MAVPVEPEFKKGHRVKSFRFDIIPLPLKESKSRIMALLTIENDAGGTLAWGFTKELGVDLAQDLTAALDKFNHTIDLNALQQNLPNAVGPNMSVQALEAFIQAGPPSILPNRLVNELTDYIKVLHLDAWPTCSIFDSTTLDGATIRFSLVPVLALMFTTQLIECVSSMP